MKRTRLSRRLPGRLTIDSPTRLANDAIWMRDLSKIPRN